MAEFISHLDIGPKIGNGHFGDVHLATDALHGEVAVKILRQNLGETDAAWKARRDGLSAEAAGLKKATHKHVVQVHQVVENAPKDAIHLIMEYCHGGSLQSAYESGPLSPVKVHRIATDVAHGLGALHDRGMLHRDIKPGNILIHAQGHAKLGDFGLVTDQIILGYAAGAGYADHLAPEVWNKGQTSRKTDIWAFGMTLYRLLHGDAWYRASPAPKHVVKDGGFANSLSWLPHISSKWRRLIRSMLNDNSLARPVDQKLLNELADLSNEVDWNCRPAPNGCVWTRQKATRSIRVEMKVVKAGKLEWEAISLPRNGKGRKMTLGRCKGPAGLRATMKDMRTFFDQAT